MTKYGNEWIYAMYKGDKFLCEGTRNQICNEMNIKKATFQFYRSEYYNKNKFSKGKNRRIIIRIQ